MTRERITIRVLVEQKEVTSNPMPKAIAIVPRLRFLLFFTLSQPFRPLAEFIIAPTNIIRKNRKSVLLKHKLKISGYSS